MTDDVEDALRKVCAWFAQRLRTEGIPKESIESAILTISTDGAMSCVITAGGREFKSESGVGCSTPVCTVTERYHPPREHKSYNKKMPYVSPSTCDRHQTYRLMTAISGNDLKMAESAVNRAADVNFVFNGQCQTILMGATIMRNPAIVRLLILHGADVNVRDRLGQSAYSFALQTKNQEIISLLKDAGASYTFVDRLNMIKNSILGPIRRYQSEKRLNEMINLYSKNV